MRYAGGVEMFRGNVARFGQEVGTFLYIVAKFRGEVVMFRERCEVQVRCWDVLA